MTKTETITGAEEALIAYGYAERADGLFERKGDPHTQAWKRNPDGDGWLRFDPPSATIGGVAGGADPSGGAPWGVLADVRSGWVQVPFGQSERFKGVGGLHPATHPECFDWIWPNEKLVLDYTYAEPGWIKDDDGSMVRDAEYDERMAAAEVALAARRTAVAARVPLWICPACSYENEWGDTDCRDCDYSIPVVTP